MSYAFSIPYTPTTLVVNCKCGTEALLTWVRQVIKGWDYNKSVCVDAHKRMRPAVHDGTIYGDVLFVVRDPVERAVSCYYDKINNPAEKRYYRKGVTIEQWIGMLESPDYLESNEHWRPQTNMMYKLHDSCTTTYIDLPRVEEMIRGILAKVRCPCPPIRNPKAKRRRYEGPAREAVPEILAARIRSIYWSDTHIHIKALSTKLK